MDDHKLLRGFVRNRSQEAFQELVDRHLGMVYSAARRMVHDPHMAEEVAQNTFRALGQKARSLRPPHVVAGWLYTTARQVAEHAKAVAQHGHEKPAPAKPVEKTADVPSILSHLDAAMGELDVLDRDALVLRYLENCSLREVELELGLGEDAARLRLSRALEHLRERLGHEGVSVTLVLLTTTLTSNVTTPPPPGLGADVTLAALSATTASVAAGEDHWFNHKAAGVMAIAAVLVGLTVYLIQQRFIDRLHADNRNLMDRQQKLSDDRDAALAAAHARDSELQLLRKDADELSKLRVEANKFGQQRQTLTALQAENKKLRDQLSQPASTTNKVANFIGKDNLALVGYETPEAALESATWAMMTGNYDEMLAASSQDIQLAELNNTKSRDEFEARQKKLAPIFQGIHLMAKKVLDDDEVEIKVQWNYTDASGKQTERHTFIQPLIKVGDVWKIKQTHDYESDWDHDGHQVLNFGP